MESRAHAGQCHAPVSMSANEGQRFPITSNNLGNGMKSAIARTIHTVADGLSSSFKQAYDLPWVYPHAFHSIKEQE